MSEEIKVSVNSWGPDRSLTLSWVDPITGKRKTRSAKTKDWHQAERLAYDLEKELEAGVVSPAKITWAEAVTRYDDEHLKTQVPKSRKTYLGSLRQLKRVLGVELLSKLNSSAISTFQSRLKGEGMKDSTLAHHLRLVKAACNWWKSLGMMREVPAFRMPFKGEAKSRPITTEEYERVLAAIPKHRPKDTEQWERFISGLWLSGLRRSEAVSLSWDADRSFCVNLRDEVFIIRSDGQKSGRAETTPMAPDFVDFLRAIPDDERTGRVFPMIDFRTNQPLTPDHIGHVIEELGRKAGVKVGTKALTTGGKEMSNEVAVFAGCHSYRRGFGSRWARKVTTSVLKVMMRHANIQTTMAYYVHLDATDISKELRQQFGRQDDSLQQICNTTPADSAIFTGNS